MEAHTEMPDTACVRLPQPSGASNETILTAGMTVTGNLCGSGMLWVEGAVKGDIEMAGAVIIAADGMVEGTVHADTVYVAGCVEGDIIAKELLRLEMTGDINGNVKTAVFLIQDGGHLNGYCTMTKESQEPIFLY